MLCRYMLAVGTTHLSTDPSHRDEHEKAILNNLLYLAQNHIFLPLSSVKCIIYKRLQMNSR